MSLLSAAADLVRRLRNDAKAAVILTDWLGEGGVPVPKELASARAKVCTGCRMNRALTKRIENSVAEAIRKQESIRNMVELRTDNDYNLHNCDACGCYLKLKVWVPIKHLDTDPKFPASCWIVKEKTAVQAIVEPKRPIVRVRREAAFGDVIQATTLATKLWESGYDVHWRCADIVRPALMGHPHIAEFIVDKNAPVDVNLDRTYEDNLERNKKGIASVFIEASDHQLRKIGVTRQDRNNLVPYLTVTQEEANEMKAVLGSISSGQIVAFVPRSNQWPARTIHTETINALPKKIDAKLVWAFPGLPPEGFYDAGITDFRSLMALIQLADVVVSPDTGPLHVAAAFNKPIVAIEQCVPINLRLTDQTDYTAVHAPLDCIRCGDFTCRIDANNPPCQKVPSDLIADAVNDKLDTLSNGKVSVVIPVYKPSDRLKKCVAALDEAFEVIIALDGDAKVEQRNCRIIPSPGVRTGFGRTCMRGARASKGEYILFLNDDCYLKAGCIEEMVSTIQRDPSIAVVGAQLWYPNGTLQHGGTFRTPGDMGFGHVDWKRNKPSITTERDMEFVTFAAALVRRSAFYALRGFDERFDTYCEDSDFCLRAKQAGYRVVYNPRAQAIHDESQTTAPTKAKMHGEAQQVFIKKWRHYFESNKPT